MDVVEELGDVEIHHLVLPPAGKLPRGSHGVGCASSGTESVAVMAEQRLEDRRHRLQQQLLDEPVQNRGDPQHPYTPARLGDFHSPDGRGDVGPVQQLGPDLIPVGFQVFLQIGGFHPVNARSAVIGHHGLERLADIFRRHRQFHQILVHCSLSKVSRNGVSRPHPWRQARGARMVHESGPCWPFQLPL